jgi:hypothetical protein
VRKSHPSSCNIISLTGTLSHLATLVADASHFVYSHIPPIPTNPVAEPVFPAQVLNCTLDGKGGGACVIKWWEDGGRYTTETFTSSYSGSAVPFYTLTVGEPEITGGGNGSTGLGGLSESVPSPTGGGSDPSGPPVSGDGPRETEDGSSDGSQGGSDSGPPRENDAISRLHAWAGFGAVGVGVLLGAGLVL